MSQTAKYGVTPRDGDCPPASPDTVTSSQIQTILIDWGIQHFRSFPWRSPEIEWHGLIAEILLQRTRAKNVIPVYERFVERFPLPGMLGSATVDEIEEIIRPLGLKWRAPLLQQLGQALATGNATVPHVETQLRHLPGVGAYAASAFLSLHAGVRSIIIDANVVRFVGRLTDCPVDAETRRKKWLIAFVDALTPHQDVRDFNYALLDFTMAICTVSPKCDICPLGEQYCAYRRKTLQKKLTDEHGTI